MAGVRCIARISGSPDEVGGDREPGLERPRDGADGQPGPPVLRGGLDGSLVDHALRTAGRVQHDDAAGLLDLGPPDRLGERHVGCHGERAARQGARPKRRQAPPHPRRRHLGGGAAPQEDAITNATM